MSQEKRRFTFAVPKLNYVYFFFNGSIANFESAYLNYAFWMCFFQPSVVGYSSR